jgi:cytochrome o ubiquinol oxidase subunit 2
MMFDVHVVPENEFSDWATKAAQSSNALNADSYGELTKQSVPKDKTVYRLTDPELFQKITTQRIAPGPGPELTAKIGAADAR